MYQRSDMMYPEREPDADVQPTQVSSDEVSILATNVDPSDAASLTTVTPTLADEESSVVFPTTYLDCSQSYPSIELLQEDVIRMAEEQGFDIKFKKLKDHREENPDPQYTRGYGYCRYRNGHDKGKQNTISSCPYRLSFNRRHNENQEPVFYLSARHVGHNHVLGLNKVMLSNGKESVRFERHLAPLEHHYIMTVGWKFSASKMRAQLENLAPHRSFEGKLLERLRSKARKASVVQKSTLTTPLVVVAPEESQNVNVPSSSSSVVVGIAADTAEVEMTGENAPDPFQQHVSKMPHRVHPFHVERVTIMEKAAKENIELAAENEAQYGVYMKAMRALKKSLTSESKKKRKRKLAEIKVPVAADVLPSPPAPPSREAMVDPGVSRYV